MHYRLKYITLITATIIFSLSSALQITSNIPGILLIAQAQTNQIRKAEADKLSQQAQQQFSNQQFDAALQSFQQALVIYKQIEDRDGEAVTLKDIGLVYIFKGDNAKGIDFIQQSLVMAKEIGFHLLEGKALFGLGLAYKNLKDYNKALEFLQHSWKIAQEVQDKKLRETVIGQLLEIYGAQGNFSQGIEYIQQGLAVAREQLNQQLEVKLLVALGLGYSQRQEYQKAIESAQAALAIGEKLQDSQITNAASGILIVGYYGQKDFPKIIELANQRLADAKKTGNTNLELSLIDVLADVYKTQGNSQKALEFYQQKLALARKEKNTFAEIQTLGSISQLYNELKDYQKTIATANQGWELAKKNQKPLGGLQSLLALINAYRVTSEYQKAINISQEGLELIQKTKITPEEVEKVRENTLLSGQAISVEFIKQVIELAIIIQLVETYDTVSDYQNIIAIGQQGLSLVRKLNISPSEAEYMASFLENKQEFKSPTILKKSLEMYMLQLLGKAYDIAGEYQKSLPVTQEALTIAREVKNPEAEAQTLLILASASSSLAFSQPEYQKNLELAQQALTIARQIKDEDIESEALNRIADIYEELNEYEKAIKFATESLTLARKSQKPATAIKPLMTLATNYLSLGDYEKFNQFSQEALATARKIKQNPLFEAVALVFVTLNHFLQGDSQKTIASAQEGLNFAQNLNIPYYKTQFEWLNNLLLGVGYNGINDYPKAIAAMQKSLALARASNSRSNVGYSLVFLAGTYRRAGQKQEAISLYQQAMAIAKETQVPGNEALINLGLARANRDLNQTVTAISYYKEAINGIEKVRTNISGLPRQLQESFLQSIQDADRTKPIDAYRELADLLLSQGRKEEARQVLDLVKLQEIRQATRGTTTQGETARITLSPDEQKIITQYGSLIAFGQKVEECKKTNCSQLSSLNSQLETLNRQYNQAVDSFVAKIRERKGKDDSFFDPRLLSDAQKIVDAQPGTVLVYPFVLEEKIWLLWMSAGGVVKSVEIPKIGQQQLANKVKQFRQLIDSPNSDISQVQATGKELYDLLVKPLEAELRENKIQNLVFALDNVTRYIPMSALYDGKNYLVENYNISIILSAELTDTKERLPIGTQNNSVLALGLSNAVPGFNPLPNVPGELDAIVKKQPQDKKGIYPGLELLNQDFTRAALRDKTNGRRILHIATHGVFDAKNVLGSFIVLGTGEKFTVNDIRNLPNLNDVHLVVLSACETALGDTSQDGVEINTISYYFMNRGAKAVMASLWLVNDESTRLLMQNFYGNLAQGTQAKPVTKAQALRQAQLALITGNYKVQGDDDRGIGVLARPGTNSTPRVKNRLSHPYYWAPFILIGNGL